MALIKEVIEDKIETIDCGNWSVIQVRTATVVYDDGVELSRSYHRHSINPTDDFSSESAKVQAICSAVHTQAAQDAYTAYLTPQEPSEGE
jgi:hypothetical protein